MAIPTSAVNSSNNCEELNQEQRIRPTMKTRRSSPSPLLLTVLVVVATLFVNAPGYCSASSVDDQSSQSSAAASSSDLSKEEPQLSANAGLVKRSAPVASYGHSIMRFGRAPHNIMHFGKRAGSSGATFDDLYSDSDNQNNQDSSAEALNSVPEWVLSNYLKGQQLAAPSNGKLVTKYLLVPIQVPASSSKASFASGPMPVKKASRFSEQDTDNVFMHFG